MAPNLHVHELRPGFCAAQGDKANDHYPLFLENVHVTGVAAPPVHYSPRHVNARSVNAVPNAEQTPRWREFHGVTHQVPMDR